MERAEEPWNEMATLNSAKEHVGTQLLFGLDADNAQIKGSMTPNRENESVQIKAEVSSGDNEEPNKILEGTINDKGGNIKVFDPSRKFLEEINCDEKSCKRTGPSGELLGAREITARYKEKLTDKSLNGQIQFDDEMFFEGKIGRVLNDSNQVVGSASLQNRGELSNLGKMFLGMDRTFHQTGTYENKESQESRSLNITYTQNWRNEVTFEGDFQRKK